MAFGCGQRMLMVKLRCDPNLNLDGSGPAETLV